MCIPNAVKIPLLRRKKVNSPSDPASRLCSESNKSNYTFLPLTVTPNAYDQGQKLQLLWHAKQTLENIDLSTSSTIIHVNQIMVQAMKSDVNSEHLLDLISCLDNGLRMHYLNRFYPGYAYVHNLFMVILIHSYFLKCPIGGLENCK